MSEQILPEPNQTILEHLNDLRVRLTWAVAGLAVATAVSFAFTEPLLNFIIAPYGEQLQTLSPTEGIQTYFRVALVSGAILSMPWMLVQFWKFVSPGLHKSEKRYVFVFVPSAFVLFLTGVSFAWFVLLPAAINFLSTFLPGVFAPEWTSNEYIGFATTFLFWLGVSFEMPLIVYFVARFGLVTARTLRQQWRFAIVGIAVVAAAVTPSIDPITMILTMVPLILLYGLSILLARLGQGQFERAMALETAGDESA